MSAKPLPAYDVLWVNYPDYDFYPQPEEVKTMIGGDVDAAWIKNTCAIRMSRALNGGGIVVPRGHKGLLTVRGGDGRNYALRVQEMRAWFATALVKPDFDLRKKSFDAFDKSAIANLTGVIAFDIPFNDATGHLDLWDGERITTESHMSHDYYEAATRITVWKTN